MKTNNKSKYLASIIALQFMRKYPLDKSRMKQVYRIAERVLTDVSNNQDTQEFTKVEVTD